MIVVIYKLFLNEPVLSCAGLFLQLFLAVIIMPLLWACLVLPLFFHFTAFVT